MEWMFSEDIVVVVVVVVGDPRRRIRNKIAKYHYCTNKRITGIVMHSHIKVLPSLTTAHWMSTLHPWMASCLLCCSLQNHSRSAASISCLWPTTHSIRFCTNCSSIAAVSWACFCCCCCLWPQKLLLLFISCRWSCLFLILRRHTPFLPPSTSATAAALLCAIHC